MKKNKPIMHDPFIIPRVKLYLEENVHQTYVDVSIMANQLQERYREYGRRKIQPFRHLVEQAYKTVLHSYGIDSNSHSDENDYDGTSDLELMDERSPPSNHLNNILTNMYKKTKLSDDQPAPEVLIDISSDDDGQKTPPETGTGETTGNVSNNTVSGERSNATVAVETGVVQKAKKRKADGSESQRSRSSPGGVAETSKQQSEDKTARKKFKYAIEMSPFTFTSIGGMTNVMKELVEIVFHFKHASFYPLLGVRAPRGVLLHGPPGCGKTLLARAIAGQLGIPMVEVVGTELVAGVSGESEQNIRELFSQAAVCAPCVLFIDEIDTISMHREKAQREMERRLASQLISSLDGLSSAKGSSQVLVVGATNKPDNLDPALRRIGRFDHEIGLGIPGRDERVEILKVICKSMSVEDPFDYTAIATLTPGFVGADLFALSTKAAALTMKRFLLNSLRQRKDKMLKNVPIVDLVDDSVGTSGDGDDDESVILLQLRTNGSGQQTVDSSTLPPLLSDADKELPKEASIFSQEPSTPIDISPESVELPPTTPQTPAEETKEPDQEHQSMDIDTPDDGSPELIEVSAAIPSSIPRSPSVSEMMVWINPATKPMAVDPMEKICVMFNDFMEAIKFITPSSKREGFITVPDVTWDNIGSLKDIREELQLNVLAPVKHPEKMKKLGLTAPSGIMLCGPPGCGKTLLAKAIANEAGINFLSVKGPELMNMYVGESERAVRTCFQRARNSAPCVIFFDEFDSLCPKRSDSSDKGSSTRIVNQLLTEMDGIEDRKGVFIMAATNRPDIIDPAVLRPGRLDTVLYVGLPSQKDRIEILEALTKKGTQPVLGDDVSLVEIASETDGYSGADLAGLVRQASLLALKEAISNTDDTDPDNDDDIYVSKAHLKSALSRSKPSVSPTDLEKYEKLKLQFATPRTRTVNV